MLRRIRKFFGRFKKRLGGDAANIKAGAAERATLLHTGRFEPQLRRTNRTHIATRPTADKNHVKRFGHV